MQKNKEVTEKESIDKVQPFGMVQVFKDEPASLAQRAAVYGILRISLDLDSAAVFKVHQHAASGMTGSAPAFPDFDFSAYSCLLNIYWTFNSPAILSFLIQSWLNIGIADENRCAASTSEMAEASAHFRMTAVSGLFHALCSPDV